MIIKSTGRGPGGPGPWMCDLKKSNGIVAEVNSHDLDSHPLVHRSRRAARLRRGAQLQVPEARERFPDFYDNVVATLRLDDDTIGVVDGTCPAHYGYDARVEILCEKGVLFVGSARRHGCEWITVEVGAARRRRRQLADVVSRRLSRRDGEFRRPPCSRIAPRSDRGRWPLGRRGGGGDQPRALRTGGPVPSEPPGVTA